MSIFLVSCTTEFDLNANIEQNSPLQTAEGEMFSFFAPGHETFEDMVDTSDLIIRGRVLNERIENVNVNITLEEAIEARIEEYEAGIISAEDRDLRIAHHQENEADFAPRYADVIFYQIEILEIFQGIYEVGDIIELFELLNSDEDGNPNLEYSFRHEVDSEFIFFLMNTPSLGYLTLHPHQAVYEIPDNLNPETDTEIILDYIDDFQINTVEIGGTIFDVSDYIPDPFEINLEILREIAEENNLIDTNNQ